MTEEEKVLPEEPAGQEPIPEKDDLFEQAVPEDQEIGGEKDIVPEQGLDLDNYDKTAPFVKGERVEDEKQGIPITYNLRPAEVTKALKYFQKKTIYKKNIIFTVILGIIVILYAQAVITDPSYTFGYILGVLALTVIGFMWYLPSRHIKSVAQATDISRDTYRLEICADGLLLPQKEGKYLLGFDSPAVKVTEFPDLFLIIVSREKVFAIPKRCIPAEQLDNITQMMKNALGGRYETLEETPGDKPRDADGSGKED